MVVLGLTAENSLLVCWFGYKLRWPSFPTDILLFYLTDVSIPLSMFTEQESTLAQKLIFKRVRIGINIIRCAEIVLL